MSIARSLGGSGPTEVSMCVFRLGAEAKIQAPLFLLFMVPPPYPQDRILAKLTSLPFIFQKKSAEALGHLKRTLSLTVVITIP